MEATESRPSSSRSSSRNRWARKGNSTTLSAEGITVSGTSTILRAKATAVTAPVENVEATAVSTTGTAT